MTGSYPNEFDVRCDLDTCKTYPVITDSERGEIFCGGCGLVLLQKLEEVGGEHKYARESAIRTRTGPKTSLMMHDRGLSTVIGRNVDATGRAIPGNARQTFGRLRIWDQRSRSRSISSLSKALIQLNTIKTKLAVPDSVAEEAAYIYRKAVAAKLTKGRTTSSLIAASLYAACRENNTPRTLDDVAAAGNVERRVISRDLRTLIKRLDLVLGQYDIGSFVVKIANNLALKEKTKRDAMSILQRAEVVRTTAGKNPVAQAAAALYIACITNGEKISQKKFSAEAGVSDVTVRNRVSLLKKVLDI